MAAPAPHLSIAKKTCNKSALRFITIYSPMCAIIVGEPGGAAGIAQMRQWCLPASASAQQRVCIVITVDVVLVNLEERTAYCSDGVTRAFSEMYDAHANPTDNPDEAIAAVVKIADDKFILLDLTGDQDVTLH